MHAVRVAEQINPIQDLETARTELSLQSQADGHNLADEAEEITSVVGRGMVQSRVD